MLKNKMNTFIILMIVLSLTSCASFGRKEISNLDTIKKQLKKKSIFVVYETEGGNIFNNFEDKVKEFMIKTDFFSKVEVSDIKSADFKLNNINLFVEKEKDKFPDLYLIVKLSSRVHGSGLWQSFWAVVSLSTLTIIPYYQEQTISLDVSIKDLKNKKESEFNTYDSISSCFNILLLPITPFYWPDKAADRTFNHLFSSLLNFMDQEKFL